MSDEYDPQITDEQGNAIPPDFGSTFLNMEEDIEVAGEGEVDEKTPAEMDLLKQQVAKQQELIAKLETKQTVDSAVAGALAPVLDRLGQPAHQPIMQQPQESEADFKKRLDENTLEMGFSTAMDQFYARKLAPEVQRLLANNVNLSRKFVQLDPSKGPLYKTYKKEVDDYVAAMPPQAKLYNPDLYEEAVNVVASRHSDEIMGLQLQTKLAEEREKLKEELRQELGLEKKTAPAKPIHSATNQNQPGPTKRTTSLSVAQLTERYPQHAKDAFIKGVPPHTYFKYLAEKGLLK